MEESKKQKEAPKTSPEHEGWRDVPLMDPSEYSYPAVLRAMTMPWRKKDKQ